jgi:hypothetical protein
MSVYLARTRIRTSLIRIANSNKVDPYGRRRIAASPLRPQSIRQVQVQIQRRTIWGFGWFTGGNPSSNSSAKKDENGSETSDGNGGKDEVEVSLIFPLILTPNDLNPPSAILDPRPSNHSNHHHMS